jgi:hypothetical protein
VRLSTYVIAIPIVVGAAVVAVANRGIVDFSLDPFSANAPAFGAHLPLFLLLFAVFGLGLLVGWIAAVWTRNPSARLLPPRRGKIKPPNR